MDHTKINLLVKLQHLDNQIEKIVSLQKGLPEEIDALDEDLVFTTRQIESRKKIADEHLKTRSRLHETISECKNKILNFKEKQTLARNNKEYDALSKQIEYEEKEIAQAEIQLQDIVHAIQRSQEIQKKGRLLIAENRYDEITEEMMPDDVLQQKLQDLKQQVEQKREELESIVIETAEDVDSLKQKVKKQRLLITAEAKRLLDKYDHLRNSVFCSLSSSTNALGRFRSTPYPT